MLGAGSLTPLKFTRSDGDSSRRPTNIDPTPDSEGHVNYHKYVGLDEPNSLSWRKRIGQEIAKQLVLDDAKGYILEDWPEGYEFFDHHKGPLENPRHDLYLFGSIHTAKFRSTNEFIPHGVWLLTDESLDSSNCRCKYCTKSKSQSLISQAHGLAISRQSAQFTPPKTRKLADFRAPVPAVKSRNPPRQLCSHRRVSDLRTFRWFREHEIVWASVDCELAFFDAEFTSNQPNTLQCWPAIVQEHNLKVHIVPATGGEKYKTRQSYSYKIKLLGLTQTCVVPESSLLPYQSFQPPVELLLSLRSAPRVSFATEADMQAISSTRVKILDMSEEAQPFNASKVDSTDVHMADAGANEDPDAIKYATRLQEVAVPLTLAIEIAARITEAWTTTDEWKFEGLRTASDGTRSNISEMRFQGIWWGTERIWQEDLVRLKMRRDLLAPEDMSTIHHATHEAASRSVLLRVASIYFVPDSTCRLAGMLYEVAEDDWEKKYVDPSLRTSPPRAPSPSLLRTPTNSFTGRDPQKFDRPHVPISPPSPTADYSNAGHSLQQLQPSPSIEDKSPIFPVASTSRNIFMTPQRQPQIAPNLSMPTTLSPPAQSNLLSPLLRRFTDPQPSPLTELESPMNGELDPLEEGSGLSYPPTIVPEGPEPLQYRFKLPAAPKGYSFRPILPANQEVWVDISFVAGRYYPGLFNARLLRPLLNADLPAKLENGGSSNPYVGRNLHSLNSLNGLEPGHLNCIEPTYWRPSRSEMVTQADRQARLVCHRHWNGEAAAIAEEQAANQSWPEMPPSSQQSRMMTPLRT